MLPSSSARGGNCPHDSKDHESRPCPHDSHLLHHNHPLNSHHHHHHPPHTLLFLLLGLLIYATIFLFRVSPLCSVHHAPTTATWWMSPSMAVGNNHELQGFQLSRSIPSAESSPQQQPENQTNGMHELNQTNSRLALAGDQQPRTVKFVPIRTMNDKANLYSGMWWQDKAHFLKNEFENVLGLEGATYRVWATKTQRIRGTRDWLDFSVEHLSKYWKYMMSDWSEHRDELRNRTLEIMTDYVHRVQPYPNGIDDSGVIESTIAIIPLVSTSKSAASDSNDQDDDQLDASEADLRKKHILGLYGGDDENENDPLRGEWDQKGLVAQLAATLVSLWRIGIPRAVVVGPSDKEHEICNEAFQMVQFQMDLWTTHMPSMELVYLKIDNTTKEERELMPMVALQNLQAVMRDADQMKASSPLSNTPTRMQAWLGANPKRWEYVWFTEGDLILHTRPEAVPALTKELAKGNLMLAHRWQLVPHSRDFANMDHPSRLLPNISNFAAVHELDPLQGDACCAVDDYFPANAKDPSKVDAVWQDQTCFVKWWECGFAQRYDRNLLSAQKDVFRDHGSLLRRHRRLVPYPLIALSSGTGVPLVHNHQRMCIPQKLGAC